MRQIGSFHRFELAKSATGAPLALPRALNEVVLLALDKESTRLVELHFPRDAFTFQEDATMPALNKGLESFGEPILETGEEQGAPYYVTAFSDGELLDDYVSRRGGLIAATTFSLVLRLLDELVEIEHHICSRGELLVEGVSLDRLMVVLEDENILRLRILDYGRWHQQREAPIGRASAADLIAPRAPRQDSGAPKAEQRPMTNLVRDISWVIFRLLTGATKPAANLERVPLLNALPGGLKATLRACLSGSEDPASKRHTRSLAELRRQVQEALLAQSRDLHGKDSRRHLVALENMVPHSMLRHLLFPETPNMEVLARRYQLEDGGSERQPFTLPVMESGGTKRRFTVQLLPPPGCLQGVDVAAVPAAMSELDPVVSPNLLKCAGAWEMPGLAFLLEDRSHELPLRHVLRERGSLKPVEARLVLAQVKLALEQAAALGLTSLDIRPGNLLLRVNARVTEREMEKLVHRHLDAWPPFTVVARGHQSLSSLMEPPVLAAKITLGLEPAAARTCWFAALAVTLLCGRRSLPVECVVPESFPPELATLITDTHRQVLHSVADLPTPEALLETLERLIPVLMRDDVEEAAPTALGQRQGGLRSLRERLKAVPTDEPMESAGSVSDFDEDQPWPDDIPHASIAPPAGRRPKQGGKGKGTDTPVSDLMKPVVEAAKKSFLKGLWSLPFVCSLFAFD